MRVCVCVSETGHWQWQGLHADGQQLISSLPALELAPGSVGDGAGSSFEAYLV